MYIEWGASGLRESGPAILAIWLGVGVGRREQDFEGNPGKSPKRSHTPDSTPSLQAREAVLVQSV